jgi:NAD(P)-dependent dehydrogenase (short-subunit alcohol dehydrogenase family)
VVIVGAGPGLGRAIGAAFVAEDADVVLVARNEERLRALADDIGAAGYVSADVGDEAALRAALDTIHQRHGTTDVVVHNPSIAFEAAPTNTPLSALLDGFRVAAGSLLVTIQQVAPAMRTRGHGTILVTGSGAGLTGSTWSASLAAQKAAVRNLAFSAAAELEPDGVKVATITINGLLGTPGFEVDRIAPEYVRLHKLAQHPRLAQHPGLAQYPGRADELPDTASALPGNSTERADAEQDVWQSEISWPAQAD